MQSVRGHLQSAEYTQVSNTTQESRKVDRKIDIRALASHSEGSRDEETLLLEAERLRKQTWWQKLSQCINMAGTWLFLHVLFVSPAHL